MKYKTIDLCAGIGGIRKGFELTGEFQTVLSAEIDKYACVTYEHLFGDNPYNDLTSEDFKQKVEKTEYDVLLAGFPCQTFSSVGLRQGFRDTTKGTIFFDIADIIQRTKPKAVFLENVDNLVSHDNGETLKTIIDTLEAELHYKVIGVGINEDGEYTYTRKSFVRNSKNFGLPQNRPRAYLMAFNKDYFGLLSQYLNDDLPICRQAGPIAANVNEILDTDVDDSFYMSAGYLETLKKHKEREKTKGNGFGYAVVNDSTSANPIANTILATGGSGKERNLIRQYKAGVSGKTVRRKRTPINSEYIRVMTPNEWGRLQGFIGYAFLDWDGNDLFSFPANIPNGEKYKQFGNSVTIPVIEEMARFMLSEFDVMYEKAKEGIIEYIQRNGAIDSYTVNKEFGLSPDAAKDLTARLINEKIIVPSENDTLLIQ